MTLALWLCAACMLGVYRAGVRSYNQRHALKPFPRLRIAAFVTGTAAIVAALSPPADTLADVSFAAHMGQHLALTLVAAPLLLLGGPLLLAVAATPPRVGRAIVAILHSAPVRSITWPVATWLLFAGVMYGTHFSALYELALDHPMVHAFEHALYFGSALLFWQAVIQIGPVPWPLNYPLRLMYLFVAMPQNAFLGLALYESRHILYPHYQFTHRLWGTPALADQQAGGAVMWVVGGLLLLTAFLMTVTSWAKEEERAAQRFDEADTPAVRVSVSA